jgi:hypothetical protein
MQPDVEAGGSRGRGDVGNRPGSAGREWAAGAAAKQAGTWVPEITALPFSLYRHSGLKMQKQDVWPMQWHHRNTARLAVAWAVGLPRLRPRLEQAG